MIENYSILFFFFFLRGRKSIVKEKRKKEKLYCRNLLRKTNFGKIENLEIKSLISPKSEYPWASLHVPQFEDLDDWREVVWDSLMEGRV